MPQLYQCTPVEFIPSFYTICSMLFAKKSSISLLSQKAVCKVKLTSGRHSDHLRIHQRMLACPKCILSSRSFPYCEQSCANIRTKVNCYYIDFFFSNIIEILKLIQRTSIREFLFNCSFNSSIFSENRKQLKSVEIRINLCQI